MQPGIYVDPAINYENAAHAWATHLDHPFNTHGREFDMDLNLLQTLFRGIHPETIEAIEVDPYAFSERVSMYRLALHSKE